MRSESQNLGRGSDVPTTGEQRQRTSPGKRSGEEPVRGNQDAAAEDHSKRKKGKRSAARRCDLLPLLPSGPDGVQRELAVRDLPFSVRGIPAKCWSV